MFPDFTFYNPTSFIGFFSDIFISVIKNKFSKFFYAYSIYKNSQVYDPFLFQLLKIFQAIQPSGKCSQEVSCLRRFGFFRIEIDRSKPEK